MLAAALAILLEVPILGSADGVPRDIERVSVTWLDESGVQVGTSAGRVANGVLIAPRASAAMKLQVAGPDFMSRVVRVKDAVQRGIALVPSTSVVLDGVVPGATLRIASSREEGEAHVVTDHEYRTLELIGSETRLRLQPGRYILGVDQGKDQPVLISDILEGLPGATVHVPRRVLASRRVVLKVRDRKGASVSGARISAPDGVDASQELAIRLLSRRAGPSGLDGLLDAGAVGVGTPTGVRVVADRFRPVTIPLTPRPDEKPGPLQVTLPPWPDIKVTVPRRTEIKGPVALERCAEWLAERRSCKGGWKRTGEAPISEGVAWFHRQAPGVYSVRVEDAGSSLMRVEVPEDPTSPDVVEVDLPLQEWIVRGETRLADDTPVRASVSVTAPSTQDRHSHRLATVESDGEGRFQARLLAPAGIEVSLHAWANEPQCRTPKGQIVRLGEEPQSVLLSLDTTGVAAQILDRETGRPIPDCAVVVQSAQEDSSLRVTLRTNEEGRISMAGLGRAAVKLIPRCSGFATNAGTVVEMREGATKDVELRLDRVGSIRLRAVDISGSVAAGVRVFALPAVLWDPPYGTPVTPIGITGLDGELDIEGDQFAGLAVFAFRPGSAMTIDRLPSGDQCHMSCDARIIVYAKSAFPGLTATTASGAPLRVEGIVFRKGSVPITLPALDELIRSSGLDTRDLFSGTEPGNFVFIPALFAPGEYEMDYSVRTAETGKLVTVPLGSIRLPASAPIEVRAMAFP